MNLVLHRLARKVSLRSKLSLIPGNRMKLQSLALAGAIVQSSAWLPSPSRHTSTLSSSIERIQRGHDSVQNIHSSTFLRSTLTPEDIDIPNPLVPTGKRIAEGTVVSVFRGGLAAVRIDDEIVEEVDDTPEVVDTTNLLPKNINSNSLGT